MSGGQEGGQAALVAVQHALGVAPSARRPASRRRCRGSPVLALRSPLSRSVRLGCSPTSRPPATSGRARTRSRRCRGRCRRRRWPSPAGRTPSRPPRSPCGPGRLPFIRLTKADTAVSSSPSSRSWAAFSSAWKSKPPSDTENTRVDTPGLDALARPGRAGTPARCGSRRCRSPPACRRRVGAGPRAASFTCGDHVVDLDQVVEAGGRAGLHARARRSTACPARSRWPRTPRGQAAAR